MSRTVNCTVTNLSGQDLTLSGSHADHGNFNSGDPVTAIVNGATTQAFEIKQGDPFYGSTGWVSYNLTGGTDPAQLYLMFNNPCTQNSWGFNGCCWFYAVIQQGGALTNVHAEVSGFTNAPADPAQTDEISVAITISPVDSSTTSTALTPVSQTDYNITLTCHITYLDGVAASGMPTNAMTLHGLLNGYTSPPSDDWSSPPAVAATIVSAGNAGDTVTPFLAYQTVCRGVGDLCDSFSYNLPDCSVLTVTLATGNFVGDFYPSIALSSGSMYEVVNATLYCDQYGYLYDYSITVQLQNSTNTGGAS